MTTSKLPSKFEQQTGIEMPRSYKLQINEAQMQLYILALETLVNKQPDILAMLPHDHADMFPDKNGLDSAKNMVDLLKQISLDETHNNDLLYGLTV